MTVNESLVQYLWYVIEVSRIKFMPDMDSLLQLQQIAFCNDRRTMCELDSHWFAILITITPS